MDTQIRIRIEGREPFAGGTSFGDTGPYERLWGQVDFAVYPDAPTYQTVVDLGYAPRNFEGLVEFSTDFYLLKPADLARGNRRLIYEVNNRGTKLLLQFLNDTVPDERPRSLEHAGNGFLMRRGYTIVWSGWQGDILPVDDRMTMKLPIASRNGDPITGVVRTEFAPADVFTGVAGPKFSPEKQGILCAPLSGNSYTASYEAVSLDTSLATFTYREYETDPRIPISPGEWQFAKLDENGKPVPSPFHCYLPAGFKPGWVYELIYTAKNPLVLGLGFTGVRDLISFLLRADVDDDGHTNPLQEDGVSIERAYGWGCSQSGRFLREFVYRGFNEDLQGRQVFQGISPFVSGGGRVTLNYRFAQPGRYPRQHYDHLYPSDQFPFAYPVITDPLIGRTDGILRRPDTDPFVIHTQSSSEYWQRRGSLVHTDTLGNDLQDHQKARVYLFSSTEHSADPLTGPQYGPYQHPTNPLNVTSLLRAMQDNLDQWVTNGTPPPDSRVPTRTDETSVPAAVAKTRFPSIPGVAHPSEANRLYVQDYGPDFDAGIVSTEPPVEYHDKEYAVLVPQVDSDGNEVPGIRGPNLEVPLATYTGWNFRPKGEAEQAMASIFGSYLPFPKTRQQRQSLGDPRPSVEERYRSRAHYVRLIALAAQELVEQRLLLEEDADRLVDQAMREKLIG
ncbi:MAG: alpha/beta hydrolase domain-containing protein, partial [Dehalococcoidia bacterium]